MIPNLPLDILLVFGPVSTLGGESAAHTFPLELDLASARSLDLAGAGVGGALTGSTGACCLVAGHMLSEATRFTTATPLPEAMSVVTPLLWRAAAQPHVVSPRRLTGETRRASVPELLAELRAVETLAVTLRAVGPASVAAVRTVAAEVMPAVVAMAMDTNLLI